MVGRFADLADAIRMLKDCAPGFVPRVTKHSIIIQYAGKSALLPKGPGIPRKANVEALRGVAVHLTKIKKLAQNLGLSAECANHFFPNLLPLP